MITGVGSTIPDGSKGQIDHLAYRLVLYMNPVELCLKSEVFKRELLVTQPVAYINGKYSKSMYRFL